MNKPRTQTLFTIAIKKMFKVVDFTEHGKIVVKHSADDWDFICSFSSLHGFNTYKWMENQQPRTSIYLK